MKERYFGLNKSNRRFNKCKDTCINQVPYYLNKDPDGLNKRDLKINLNSEYGRQKVSEKVTSRSFMELLESLPDSC